MAEAALQQVHLSSWKMGADESGQNYYYNWVTGDSRYDKPEGWYPNSEEVWIKQTDARNNVFYFNQDTLETAWFPPCVVCAKLEAKKICFTCDDPGMFYCNDCFDEAHDEDEEKAHKWRGADQDKEELNPGEKHCLVCGKAKCVVTCKVCRDSYCQPCFKEKHSHGQLAHHPVLPYEEARRGWQKIEGRVQGERTYYYNVATGENRFDKPEEFMLDDELREHKNFVRFKKAADTHSKRVEELQIEVERLQYDKDTTMYNLSKRRGAEQDELEELRKLLLADQNKLGFFGKYGKVIANPYAFWKEQRDVKRRKRRMYRKMLLLNKREREAAFHDDVFAPPEDTRSDKQKKQQVLNSKGVAVVTNLNY